MFAHDPAGSRPWNPDSVTHRVATLAENAGVNATVKSLRHYNATQLLAAGVDLRTTAGRLGHGCGGATTLRVYAHPTSDADRRAAAALTAGLPTRSALASQPTSNFGVWTVRSYTDRETTGT